MRRLLPVVCACAVVPLLTLSPAGLSTSSGEPAITIPQLSLGDCIEAVRSELDQARARHAQTRQPFSVDFERTPLGKAVDEIRRASGMSVFVNWPSLQLAGVTAETPVTLSSAPMPVLAVLDALSAQLSVSAEFPRDGVACRVDPLSGIVEVARVVDLWRIELRRYDIADLFDTTDSDPQRRAEHENALTGFIRGQVFIGLDERFKRPQLRVGGGELFVWAYREEHERVQALLGLLRTGPTPCVSAPE